MIAKYCPYCGLPAISCGLVQRVNEQTETNILPSYELLHCNICNADARILEATA